MRPRPPTGPPLIRPIFVDLAAAGPQPLTDPSAFEIGEKGWGGTCFLSRSQAKAVKKSASALDRLIDGIQTVTRRCLWKGLMHERGRTVRGRLFAGLNRCRSRPMVAPRGRWGIVIADVRIHCPHQRCKIDRPHTAKRCELTLFCTTCGSIKTSNQTEALLRPCSPNGSSYRLHIRNTLTYGICPWPAGWASGLPKTAEWPCRIFVDGAYSHTKSGCLLCLTPDQHKAGIREKESPLPVPFNLVCLNIAQSSATPIPSKTSPDVQQLLMKARASTVNRYDEWLSDDVDDDVSSSSSDEEEKQKRLAKVDTLRRKQAETKARSENAGIAAVAREAMAAAQLATAPDDLDSLHEVATLVEDYESLIWPAGISVKDVKERYSAKQAT